MIDARQSLRGHFSLRPRQLIGIFLAQLIGFTLLFLGGQLFLDIRSATKLRESTMGKEYRVITKHISALNTLSSALGKKGSRSFSEEEIKQIEEKPWCRRVGAFSSSNYQVLASVGVEMIGEELSTLLFFESLPSDFVDVPKEEFRFDASNPIIPIVLPKDYLSLYNFGFATTLGLPQLSESLIKRVVIDFTLYSETGEVLRLKGRIVAFSQRLNTIVVPEDFMQWSRRELGLSSQTAPARLIIELNDTESMAMKEFFEANDYEVAGEKSKTEQLNYTLSLVSLFVLALGGFICLLVFALLLLSLYLLIQRDLHFIKTLFLLGYTPRMVRQNYFRSILPVYALAWGIAILITLGIRFLYHPLLNVLADVGYFPFVELLLLALFVLLLVVGMSRFFLGRKILRMY